MSRPRPLPRCCFCVEPLGREDFRLVMDEPTGSKLVLGWHTKPCAEEDPLHIDLATALSTPNGDSGDDAISRAVLALHDRIALRGAEALRACMDVRRDVPDVRVTLRGDGLEWGRLSRR